MTVESVSNAVFVKRNDLAYSFSNMSPDLFKVYPASVRSAYQLYNRKLGMMTLRLRRSMFETASESSTYDRMCRRYHDFWMNNNLLIAGAAGAGIARPSTRDWATWEYKSYE